MSYPTFVEGLITTYIQPFVLLSALFLKLPENKHHVCGTPVGSEDTLALKTLFFRNGGYQSIQKNPCEDFFYDGEESNLLVIIAV